MYVCWVCSKVYEKQRRSLNCYCGEACRKKQERKEKRTTSNIHTKRCRGCHKDFKTTRSDTLTCSVKCRVKRHRIINS